MTDCLIGYTGFIGGNLLKKHNFDECYNSKNINEIRNKEFNTVYCAALSATRWLVNKDPETDLASVNLLIDCLRTVKAKRFISTATIDVYTNPIDVDELTPTNINKNHPYGAHRHILEKFVLRESDFEYPLSVRLPIVFGVGFKKNVIYDMIYDNEVYKINPNNKLQFYDVACLYDDIQIALNNNIHVINFATEPITVNNIAERVFPEINLEEKSVAPFIYNMKTIYHGLYNRKEQYIYTANEIINQIMLLVMKLK